MKVERRESANFWQWIRVAVGIGMSVLFMLFILKLAVVGGVGLFIVGLITIPSIYLMIKGTESLRGSAGERFRHTYVKLEQAGLNVVDFVRKGEIFSLLSTKKEYLCLEEFISMAQKQNQDTVYRNLELAPWGYNEYYYVFDQDKTTAWAYRVGWQPR